MSEAGAPSDATAEDASVADSADVVLTPACEAQYKDLSALRDQATMCTSLSAACGKLVPDLCCPISVTDDTTADVQAFKAAVEAYRAKCPFACPNAGKIDPNTPCRNAPSNKCTGQAFAHCVQ